MGYLDVIVQFGLAGERNTAGRTGIDRRHFRWDLLRWYFRVHNLDVIAHFGLAGERNTAVGTGIDRRCFRRRVEYARVLLELGHGGESGAAQRAHVYHLWWLPGVGGTDVGKKLRFSSELGGAVGAGIDWCLGRHFRWSLRGCWFIPGPVDLH